MPNKKVSSKKALTKGGRFGRPFNEYDPTKPKPKPNKPKPKPKPNKPKPSKPSKPAKRPPKRKPTKKPPKKPTKVNIFDYLINRKKDQEERINQIMKK